MKNLNTGTSSFETFCKFPSYLTEIEASLTEQSNTFQAGRVAKSLDNWKSVMSDKHILTTVLEQKSNLTNLFCKERYIVFKN